MIVFYLGTSLLHRLHFLQRRFPSATVTNEAHWVQERKYHSTLLSISHIAARTYP